MQKPSMKKHFMKLCSLTIMLALIGSMVFPHIPVSVLAAELDPNDPSYNANWPALPFTEDFESGSPVIQNSDAGNRTIGEYRTSGGVGGGAYYVVSKDPYNGPAVFLDNRVNTTARKFFITAYIKADSDEDMYNSVEMWGGNEYSTDTCKYVTGLYQTFARRKLSNQWEQIKAVIEVPAEKFIEVRIKSVSVPFCIDNVTAKLFEEGVDNPIMDPDPQEPEEPGYDETFEMTEFTVVDGYGYRQEGNTIYYDNEAWRHALIELPYEIDLSKYGNMTITGSASTEFRHSFFDKYKVNLMGDNQYSYNGSFDDKFSYSISLTGKAKYLALDSRNDQGLVLTIDSIKFSKKIVASDDAIKTFKDVGNNNPISTQRFTADPYAIEYNGRVYVYGTNDSEALVPDEEGNYSEVSYSLIKTLNCYSSADMVNWTDHGPINVAGKGMGVAEWASNSWAPAIAHKKINNKDKFFLYFANNASNIGVLTSDSPTGPWTSPLDGPLISSMTPGTEGVVWLFDPAVLVDDDGTGYLYFGGGIPGGDNPTDAQKANPQTARVIKLGDDMISTVGSAELIDAPYMFEDSGINKIGDTYYYSYCTNWNTWTDDFGNTIKPAEIAYMTSKNPMGPFEYKGSILKNPSDFFSGTSGNNHHCMLMLKNQLYIFYHTQKYRLDLELGIPEGYRTTYVDKMTVNADGSIAPGTMTTEGVESIGVNVNPYIRNEAESFAWSIGTSTAACSDPSPLFGATNRVLSGISNGGWIGVAGVDFKEGGAKKLTVRTSSKQSGGKIKVYLDNRTTGTLVATINVANTGDANVYQEVEASLTSSPQGVHDLFFVFEGDGTRMDYWQFGTSGTTAPTPTPVPTQTASPSPAPSQVPSNIAVTGVSLNKQTLSLAMKKSATLKANLAPANATNKNVTWKSSKTSVATVNKNGKVTAKKPGKATITVTTEDGNKTAACVVTVRKPTIKLNLSSLKMKVRQSNKKLKIKSSKPTGEKVKSVKSNKKKIVAVSLKNKKITITAKKKGKAVITVTSTNGGKASVKVTVK